MIRRLSKIASIIMLLVFVALALLWLMGPTLLRLFAGDEQISWGGPRRYSAGFIWSNSIFIRADDLPPGARLSDAAHRSPDLTYGSDARRYELFYTSGRVAHGVGSPIRYDAGTRALITGTAGNSAFWSSGPRKRYWWIEISLWLPLAVTFGLLSLILLARYKRSLSRVLWRALTERRFRSGRCRHCGYNLTGNISGVCPECGAEVTQKLETTV